jgi:hypothetical protein
MSELQARLLTSLLEDETIASNAHTFKVFLETGASSALPMSSSAKHGKRKAHNDESASTPRSRCREEGFNRSQE